MAIILGGKELAAIFAAGVTSGTGGAKAVEEFRKLIRDLSGEEPEYGDSVEFSLGRINDHLNDHGIAEWPDRMPG